MSFRWDSSVFLSLTVARIARAGTVCKVTMCSDLANNDKSKICCDVINEKNLQIGEGYTHLSSDLRKA